MVVSHYCLEINLSLFRRLNIVFLKKSVWYISHYIAIIIERVGSQQLMTETMERFLYDRSR